MNSSALDLKLSHNKTSKAIVKDGNIRDELNLFITSQDIEMV